LLVDQEYDNYLILEDDIEFIDRNMRMSLNKVFRLSKELDEWDIIYLGHSIKRDCFHQYMENFKNQREIILIPHITSITIGGIFGYLLSKSGAKKFIDFIKQNGIKHGIDYLMFKYSKEMNLVQYECVPRLILSEYVDISHRVDSDIQYNRDVLVFTNEKLND
jgi:GR25 family glycosyltransferase involved in LPS biosynthesis